MTCLAPSRCPTSGIMCFGAGYKPAHIANKCIQQAGEISSLERS